MGGGDDSNLYLSARWDPAICILPLSFISFIPHLIGIKTRNQKQPEEILGEMLRHPVLEPGVFPPADLEQEDKVPTFCSSPHRFIFLGMKM